MKLNSQVSYFDSMGRPTIPGQQAFNGLGRVLPPVLTTAQRDDYQPLPGEVIYNATTGKQNYWNDVTEAWEVITSV